MGAGTMSKGRHPLDLELWSMRTGRTAISRIPQYSTGRGNDWGG
jgi:hypothetical protein